MKEVVLEAGGLLRGSSAPALETFLRRHAGIHHAEANVMSDTITVGYDETVISEAEIRRLIEQCGYHCGGEVLPRHVCAPELDVAAERRPPASADEHAGHVLAPAAPPRPPEHAGHAMPTEKAPVASGMAQMAHEMGHGAGMSMEGMVRDMRNRF